MYYLGIDLGGTNIVAGVVDQNFNLISKVSCKTAVPRSEEEICNDMKYLALTALSNVNLTIEDIPWVGIGAPGSANIKTGIIEYSANLYFNNWNLAKMMQKLLNKRVIIENDANAAAYGEYVVGSAKGAKIAITITLGTGVGCGIIIDGEIYRGSNYNGAEMGHMVIEHNGKPCSCGRKGCWETYASATGLSGLTRDVLRKYNNPNDTIIWDMIKGNLNNVSGRTAYQAMAKGDAVGAEIVDLYTSYLGCGLVNVVNIFQPDIICIGGGISKEGDKLLVPLRKYIEKERYSKQAKKQTKLCIASLGNDAGIIGASILGNTIKEEIV